jgi:hypothetical protein
MIPILFHPSHKIVDSTKLQTYMECPRSYFYEYILGWRPEVPNIHLEFGKAWHLAMEHLILHGYEAESIRDAHIAFLIHYRKFFPEMMDLDNAPKDPNNALRALVGYALEYKDDNFKPIYTEISGTVPLTDKHILHFRMDSILETEGSIRSREHKTGSTVSRQWTDQWSLSIQTFVYNHVLCCLYPPERVWGVEINGTFFQKKENKYLRVPARRNLDMMQASYWNVVHVMHQLDFDMNLLFNEASDSDAVMMCFAMNPTNCTKYFGCRYHDFCLAWPNPLRRCEEVPLGFKTEYWDPSLEDAKHRFNLEGRS